MEAVDILIAGVGGQGTLLASRIIGFWGLREGFDVKVSEVHGMAQRGGSVVTHVRLAEKVFSPLIDRADVLLAFERMEGLRWMPSLKQGGKLIVNDRRISPMTVVTGAAPYPETGFPQDAIVFDAQAIAESAGDARGMNCALIGALAKAKGSSADGWLAAVEACVPKRSIDMNKRAFMLGYSL